MKLHPTQSPLKSHITPPRPSISTAKLTSPLRRNASYPLCLLDSRSAISSSSPTTKLSRVFPAISLLLLSIRSKTSTVEHQMYSSSLSPTCPETQKDTSRPSRSSRTIEADFFEPEFNDFTTIDETSEAPLTSTQCAKLRKIKSFGGAIAGYAYIDVYTGCADGILVNSMAKPLPLVKATVQSLKAKSHKVEVFSADQGVPIPRSYSGSPKVSPRGREYCTRMWRSLQPQQRYSVH